MSSRVPTQCQVRSQISNVPVPVQIVASRDDFAERGSVSRSTSIATDALDLSKRWVAGKAPAGHRPALLWLRLRRTALYPRVALCQTLGNSGAWDRSYALPNTIRRYGRLSEYRYATVNGPSKIVRLMTSVFAWCGPCFTPFGAKKNAPVV